ncbi:Protein of unknown function [Bacillus wiedmannii]|nr:Protein of unknown function [Bacillus wiedmannii]
MVKIESSL